jgi:hypothetical protein
MVSALCIFSKIHGGTSSYTPVLLRMIANLVQI